MQFLKSVLAQVKEKEQPKTLKCGSEHQKINNAWLSILNSLMFDF